MAARYTFAVAIFGEGYIYAAHATGTKRLQIGRVTECGNKFFTMYAANKLQNGLTILDFVLFAVYKSKFFIGFRPARITAAARIGSFTVGNVSG